MLVLRDAAGSDSAGAALMTAAVASAETAMIFKVCFIGRLLWKSDLLFSLNPQLT
jgi:hypothetical protein